ncbi:MAG: hypothetical protein ACTHLY_21055 [Pseudolabrys sp.]
MQINRVQINRLQMNGLQTSKVYQLAGAAVAAALIAGGVVGFPGLTEASRTQTVTAAPLAAPVPADNSMEAIRGWPYVQRGTNVRLVTTDRLN